MPNKMATPSLTSLTIFELSQLMLDSDRDFNNRLDSVNAERARLHREELYKAALEHERIRANAERERERIHLEEERRRLLQEEEQRQELERLRQQKAREDAERQQRMLEDKRRELESRQKALEQAKLLAEYERKIELQRTQEESQRKQKEEADRAAKEAAAAAEKLRIEKAQLAKSQESAIPAPPPASAPKPSLPTAQSTQEGQSSLTSSIKERETIHNKYLDLHKRLKQFRRRLDKEIRGDPKVKTILGNTRRQINSRVGQINTDKTHNGDITNGLRQDFAVAVNTPGPTVDIRQFLISQPIPTLSNESEAQYPAYLLYFLLYFTKSVINQIKSEASGEGQTIHWIGLVAASLFADAQYFWKDQSLIDIFLAKYHKVCPVLFGVYGNEGTVQGRERLGWARPGGDFVDSNDHKQRMRGLGSGYASLTLRAFKRRPAIPASEYWRALSRLINTPSANLTDTHLVVIRAMVKDHGEKFINHYGQAAVAALKVAVIDVPSRAPSKCKQEADALRATAETWKKNLHLTLE